MKIKGQHKSFSKELILMAFLIVLLGCAFVTSTYLKHKGMGAKKAPKSELKENIQQSFVGSLMDISINKAAFERLSLKREEALKKGLLFSSKDDLVDANIKIEGKEYACKLRLKGDLLDHLRGDRWSFRIILKNGEEWNGMSVFSIHNSKARSHTGEWLMHELFRQEGIIVPDYDFIKTKVNGINLGVYAYEHHFENQMLKKNEREVGPILKHNDDSYWDNVQAKLDPFPWIEGSHIELFNKNNMNDPRFQQMAETGIAMLNAFLNEEKTVGEVFDVDLMAKYYALLDLSHAWHAQQFTNIRFYLNPSSGKLEPIAFDCFGDHLPNVTSDWDSFGEGFNSAASKSAAYERSNVYRYHMLQDRDFFKLYMSYLNEFVNPTYLQKFKKEIEAPLEARAKYIQSDTLYKNFNPNFDKLFVKAHFTNKKLLPRSNLSVKAYRVNGSKQEVELQSFHSFPIEVIGFGSETEITEKLSEVVFLESYNSKSPVQSIKVKSKSPIEYIYYQLLGDNKIHKQKVLKNNAPLKTVETIQTNLVSTLQLPFVSQVGNQIIIDSGKHSINQAIVIPSDHELIISPGAELNFEGGGSLCSYSPIQARGTSQQPIILYSTGVQGAGILLSDAIGKSQFEYCNFIGLSSYTNQNVNVKGAISIYNSEADFVKSNFRKINAKEALSVRNATASVKECEFKDVQGTAIRSYYSRLFVRNINMEGVGKNGVSITSGDLDAADVVFRNILNKALSFSENAKAYLFKVDVFDSYQSFYASDHSDVKLVRFWNQNVERGIELRSGEEPFAKVELDQFNHKEVAKVFLIKQGLSVMVNGKKEKG